MTWFWLVKSWTLNTSRVLAGRDQAAGAVSGDGKHQGREESESQPRPTNVRFPPRAPRQEARRTGPGARGADRSWDRCPAGEDATWAVGQPQRDGYHRGQDHD